MQTNKEILAEIQADQDSCFDNSLAYIREHKDRLYERLNEYFEHKYRVIFSSDDYDYIEDAVLIAELDEVFAQ
jgi:hypothetical protein